MSARAILPGTLFLSFAFLLSLLVAVSLPALPTLDIARCHFTGGTALRVSTNTESINQIRFGIWAYCIYDAQTSHRTCIVQVFPGHGYSVQLLSATNDITLGSGATRGLAVHPVATGVIFIALLFSLSSRFTLALLSSLLSFTAALLTVIAFAIDITLYTVVHNKVHRLGDVQVRSVAGPGFWITLASLILLLIAGCTGCFGRHRSRMTGATDYMDPEKPEFFARFRRVWM